MNAHVGKDGHVIDFTEQAERVVVLTRQGCHLCDEAIAQVAASLRRNRAGVRGS